VIAVSKKVEAASRRFVSVKRFEASGETPLPQFSKSLFAHARGLCYDKSGCGSFFTLSYFLVARRT
jgi:hypothetical protein